MKKVTFITMALVLAAGWLATTEISGAAAHMSPAAKTPAHAPKSFGKKNWQEGLNAWQENRTQDAAQIFSGLLTGKTLSPLKRSAAAYWAYRAFDALGQSDQADHYLALAAQTPRSFYGILARKKLGQPLDLDSQPPTLSAEEMATLAQDPAVARVLALAEAGDTQKAERDLYALFGRHDADGKQQLLALAYRLNLASAQMKMAHRLDDGRALDFAKYPVPAYQPHNGYTVDPALIFALARQESGFHTGAKNASGATGLMQLMPKTAQLLQKQYRTAGNMNDPEFNITLGQHYVRDLLKNDLVEGNLVYLLAAYNAGPARLKGWKEQFSQADPLLFMESIPFEETRHFVTQVLTNYWIYSELAENPSTSALELANNQWPTYDHGIKPTAMLMAMDRVN